MEPSEPDAEPEPSPKPLPPEVLAKMPASYFAERAGGDGGGDEGSPLSRFLRRHAAELDLLAVVVGLVLVALSLSLRQPLGVAFDPTRSLLARITGWVGGLTFLSGAAGFARRAGLLEGPLHDRTGSPTLRLRLLQAQGLAVLRGVMIVASCVLALALGGLHFSASTLAPASIPAPAQWPAWMTDLGVMARPPASWTFDHASELRAQDAPLRVAWLRGADAEGAPPLHAIATLRAPRASSALAHEVAMAISHEIPRRRDGIACREEPPATHAFALCVRDDAPSPFVLACADHPGTIVCVASWDTGESGTVARELEGTLRGILPRGL